jgi:hypothetical protein
MARTQVSLCINQLRCHPPMKAQKDRKQKFKSSRVEECARNPKACHGVHTSHPNKLVESRHLFLMDRARIQKGAHAQKTTQDGGQATYTHSIYCQPMDDYSYRKIQVRRSPTYAAHTKTGQKNLGLHESKIAFTIAMTTSPTLIQTKRIPEKYSQSVNKSSINRDLVGGDV